MKPALWIALLLSLFAPRVALADVVVTTTCGEEIASPCEPTEILGLFVFGWSGEVAIDWGDGGSGVATIPAPEADDQQTATHAYDACGDFTVTVTQGGASASAVVYVR